MALRGSVSLIISSSSIGAISWRRKQHCIFRSSSKRFSSPLCLQSPPLLSTTVAALPPRVINTSLKASFNLIALCGFIIIMQKNGRLPLDAAPVLSQVSFNLVIPCFLMSKVANTISLQQDWRFLVLPLVALIQIALGGILGRLASVFLYRRSSISPSEDNYSVKEALITAACAFGNTVTLPLVFLNGMLRQTDYSTAAGYLALYMVGWSPCLWTLGYQIMNSTSGPLQQTNVNSKFSWHKLVDWWKELMNPPLYGVLIGILIGATPLSYLCLPAKHKMHVLDTSTTKNLLFSLCPLLANILQPILEGATLLGSATVPLQTIVLASTLASSIGCDEDNEGKSDASARLWEKYTANGIMLEDKAFWAITAIRLLVMPAIIFTLLIAIQHQGWLPADPLSKLILLVVGAMPTAQNLVVLAQLHSNTRPFAGVLANVLVRQYLISIVSLTVWMPIFFSFLRL